MRALESPLHGIRVESRYALRRFLRAGKYFLGDHPIFLPLLLRLTPEGTGRAITDDTAIVIEGFPRSGNTFAVFAFRDAQGPDVKAVSHVHHPAQVIAAARAQVPILLVIRDPLPCLASYLVTAPHGRPEGVIREFIHYHRKLLPYRDQVVVGDFDRVTNAFSDVIDDVNNRFATSFGPFDQSPDNVDTVFASIEAYHAETHPNMNAEQIVPRPSSERKGENARYLELLQAPELSDLLAEATSIYRQFSPEPRVG